jgi:hypothetical protein
MQACPLNVLPQLIEDFRPSIFAGISVVKEARMKHCCRVAPHNTRVDECLRDTKNIRLKSGRKYNKNPY